MSQDFSFTLSRWHAIADRLKQMLEAGKQQVQATLGQTVLDYAPNDEQQKALKARGAEALKALEGLDALQDAIGVIRGALAEANANAGVSGMLSHAERYRQKIRWYGELLSIDPLRQVPLAQVSEALASRTAESRFRGGISVALVPLNALEPYRLKKAQAEAALAKLLDSINNANRTTLDLTLPLSAELCAQAGLKM